MSDYTPRDRDRVIALKQSVEQIISTDSNAVFVTDSDYVSDNISDLSTLLTLGASVVICAPSEAEAIHAHFKTFRTAYRISAILGSNDQTRPKSTGYFRIEFTSTDMPSMSSTILVGTSGSTGAPKFVEHSVTKLLDGMKSPTNSMVSWGLLYPFYKFAGLQVILQAIKGCSVLCGVESSIKVTNLPEVSAVLCANDVTHISSTPSIIRLLLATGFAHDSLRNITLGGEIADRNVLNKLRSIFPKANIRHIYASTELGVIISVKDGDEGIPDYEIENNSRFKLDKEGQLFVRPSKNSPISYCLKGGEFVNCGWVPTGDVLEKLNNRYFFKGRQSSIINVGGNKVYPEKIEAFILRSCDSVISVSVEGIHSPFLGQVIAATVTIDSTTDQICVKDQIKRACKNELQNHEIPLKINFNSEMEIADSGKKRRNS